MNSLKHRNGVIDTVLSTPFWRVGETHHFGESRGMAGGNKSLGTVLGNALGSKAGDILGGLLGGKK